MDKARILIVEDVAIIAMEIEDQLQSMGYEVTAIVDTGKKAIEKAEEDKPDIILMDIRIKGEMDGIEAAEVIRSRFCIPVIFSTAYHDKGQIERAKLAIPFGYVLKPIQKRDLKVTIEMALYVVKVDEERRKAEKMLQKSEEKYRNLFEQSPEPIIILNMDGIVSDCNKVAGSIDYGREELIGKNFSELEILQQDRDKYEAILDRVVKGQIEIFEVEINLRNEDVIWLEIHPAIINDENNKSIRLIIRDMTNRRKAEEALRESEVKYRKLVNDSPDLVYRTDNTGKITFISQSVERLSGYTIEEAIGINMAKEVYVYPDQRKAFISELIKNGQIQNFENPLKRKDGSIWWGSANARLLTDVDGNILGVEGIVRDITERIQAEEVLQKINDELEATVEQRTAELKEINNALTILLQKSQEDKIKLEEKVLSNVKELIIPIMKKLRKSQFDEEQMSLLNTIETNLNNIISPFSRILSSKYSSLTPKEIQIANLIKEGKISKEIAESIGSSTNTVEFHRKNLRKKLGLIKTKKNLKTHLLSLP
jgi:PAS domain S-box-containing protein